MELNLQQQMDQAEAIQLSMYDVASSANDFWNRKSESVLTAIKADLALFESSRVRRRGLDLVYKYLMSISAASVEATGFFGSWNAVYKN